tara:strand:+ start:78933 stop:79382 length:450 start_codon:yes stop_codon:yes gene_type:complete
MNKEELRDLIFKEMKTMLQDDAVFKKADAPGILPDFDTPGEPDSENNKGSTDMDSCPQCGSPHTNQTPEKNGEGHRNASYMAKPQLYGIVKNAINIFNMLDEGERIDDWMESNIAQTSRMLESINNKLEYKENGIKHSDMRISILGDDE